MTLAISNELQMSCVDFGMLHNKTIIMRLRHTNVPTVEIMIVEQVLLTCAIPEPIRPPPITVTWLIIDGADDKKRAIFPL